MCIRGGLWRGQKGFRTKRWELLTECAKKNLDLGVKHVKAHRTEKEMKTMAKYQQIVMEGNGKADELAKGRRRSGWKANGEGMWHLMEQIN